jgi:hypothetical protein
MIEADLQHFNALTDHERQRLYALVVLLAYFIRHLQPESGWIERFRDFVVSEASIGGMTPETSMGFPPNWQKLPIWNPTP